MKMKSLLWCAILFCSVIKGQQNRASVDYIFRDSTVCKIEKLPVNSRASDFGITPYRNGYVFSSSRESNHVVHYNNAENANLFDLYYFSWTGKGCSKARPFARSLRSKMNESSVSLARDEAFLVYTGNHLYQVPGTSRHNLGLFEAKRSGSGWTTPKLLAFCKPEFNYEQAFLADNDCTLYFVSDYPGGSGGKDIWISRRINQEWTEPINAGATINSAYDDVFPFVTADGALYFSSNRPGGKGGLDIYVVTDIKAQRKPELVNGVLNTTADEFAFWINSEYTQGFFSSNRGGDASDDNIYSFMIDWPVAGVQDTFRNPQLCFNFFEEASSGTGDTAAMKFTWTFHDQRVAYGYSVWHCYDSTGVYPISLEIRDSSAGDLVISNVEYIFEVSSPNYIDFKAPDSVRAGEEVLIDTRESECDSMKIVSVRYDFGNGFRTGGRTATHVYGYSGEYFPKIYFKLRDDVTGAEKIYCMTKRITVY